jgi:hypothetical protein
MLAILDAVKGYKTYASAVSGVLVASAGLFQLIDTDIAVWLLAINGFLTAAFLRAGVQSDAA